jgi:opacity protein-like surface antigen
LLFIPLTALSQEAPGALYSRRNTFSSFVEYSNDSSHIILGDAENRKIGALGFQYQWRLLNRRLWNFSYTAEMRPGMLESDPVQTVTNLQTAPVVASYFNNYGPVMKCSAFNEPYNVLDTFQVPPVDYVGVDVFTCSRRTVIEQGFSPAGMRFNLMPRHRLQLTFSSYGGYMFATQEVPIPDAGSFNFTFEFGGGLEFFRTHNRSMRLEYQVQHYSNKDSAYSNPGVDSGFIKLTYAFGR